MLDPQHQDPLNGNPFQFPDTSPTILYHPEPMNPVNQHHQTPLFMDSSPSIPLQPLLIPHTTTPTPSSTDLFHQFLPSQPPIPTDAPQEQHWPDSPTLDTLTTTTSSTAPQRTGRTLTRRLDTHSRTQSIHTYQPLEEPLWTYPDATFDPATRFRMATWPSQTPVIAQEQSFGMIPYVLDMGVGVNMNMPMNMNMGYLNVNENSFPTTGDDEPETGEQTATTKFVRRSTRRKPSNEAKEDNTATTTTTTGSTTKRKRRTSSMSLSTTSTGSMDGEEDDEDEDDTGTPTTKRKRYLERNRIAASKCRAKRKQWIAEMEARERDLEREKSELLAVRERVLMEKMRLREMVLSHAGCGDKAILEYCMAIQAENGVNGGINGSVAMNGDVNSAKRVDGNKDAQTEWVFMNGGGEGNSNGPNANNVGR